MNWEIGFIHADLDTNPIALTLRMDVEMNISPEKLECPPLGTSRILSESEICFESVEGKKYYWYVMLLITHDGFVRLYLKRPDPSAPLVGYAFGFGVHGFLAPANGDLWYTNGFLRGDDLSDNSSLWIVLWAASKANVNVDPQVWPIMNYINPINKNLLLYFRFEVFTWRLETAIVYQPMGIHHKVPMIDMADAQNLPERFKMRATDLCIYMEDGVIRTHMDFICENDPGIREYIQAGCALHFGRCTWVKIENEKLQMMHRIIKFMYGIVFPFTVAEHAEMLTMVIRRDLKHLYAKLSSMLFITHT